MKSATTDTICITGMGMVTSLGLNVTNSCAAARAGITRLSKLNVLNFINDEIFGGEPLVGHTVPYISNGFVGIAKVLLLGHHALMDLLARRKIPEEEFSRTGIYINLSDQFFLDAYTTAELKEMEEFLKIHSINKALGNSIDEGLPSISWKKECNNFIQKLLASCNITIPTSNHHIYFGNHTGFVNALQDAIISMRSDKIDRYIIGGIDSCINPSFLVATAAMGVLKTSANPFGFIPGEAASFILIEKEEVIHKGIEFLSLIMSNAIDEDESNRLSDTPPKGVALTKTIDFVLSKFTNSSQKVRLIIGDLNGDSYRAIDWGYALVLLQNKYKLGDTPLWLPATAFGETGAATGALAICMGTRAFQRNYIYPGSILIWLSSDNGSKAAISLKSAQKF